MKTNLEKQLVAQINSSVGLLLLRDNPAFTRSVKFEVQQRVTKLLRDETPENIEQYQLIANAMRALARKLLACQNREQLEIAFAVINGINTEEVYITAEGQEILFENEE